MAARKKAEAEPAAEADALPGVPLPRERGSLAGHAAAVAAFRAAAGSGRLHHAWLLAGPRGIGKATFAFSAARELLAPEGEGADERTARLVAAGAHPGLLHLHRPFDPKSKRFRTQLTVDEVRRLVPFLGETAAEGGGRVVIVDPADDMNPSAANAILKTLEEPPQRTVFFLVAHAPGRLLPTIRSRCRVLRLAPLSHEEILAVLGATPATASREAADLEAAARLAAGSVRRALMVLTTDALAIARELEALLSRPRLFDRKARHLLADRILSVRDDEAFDLALDTVRDLVAAMVRAAAGEGASPEALAALSTLWSDFEARRRRLDVFNLDRRQHLLDLLAALAADPLVRGRLLADGPGRG